MLLSKQSLHAGCTVLLGCSLLGSTQASAQQGNDTAPSAPVIAFAAFEPARPGSSSSLPDEPQAADASVPPQSQDGQTKRILGVIPNFRSVNADAKLPPQTVKEKFVTASEDTFDYSAFLLPAAIAGYSQLTNSTPEFGTGPVAYGRYYWHSFVDQTVENYAVEFLVPVIAHEDTRYYTLGHGGFWKRTEYSLSRVVVTRSDSGKRVFNAGEVVGAGMAAGLSNLYYPSPERTFGNTAGKWGQSVGIDAAVFVFKEFWPDINHKLFHDGDK
ncbi:MAG TPA: hypothetical protein VGC07_03600 [Granulicella sp.]